MPLRRILSILALAGAGCTVAQAQQSIDETVRIFDQMETRARQAPLPRGPDRQTRATTPFLQAIPRFREATSGLREAVGAQTDLREPVRSVQKLIDPLTDYLKAMKLKPSPVHPAEFREYSAKELVWETLTTAERIDNNLQLAGRVIYETTRSGVISIAALEFFGDLHTDLERLKWLAGKTAERRATTR